MPRYFEIVSVENYKGRICVVVCCSPGGYHNGYVSTLSKVSYSDKNMNDIETDELTFDGDLDSYEDNRIPKGTWFVGFDTAHARNDRRPETKTYLWTHHTTLKLANELIAKGI